jgi:OOP family OmpA-OmpF porin
MSTNNAPWWILLLVWMGASTYWHVCKVKELCVETAFVDAPPPPPPVNIDPLRIQEADSLTLIAQGNFSFAKSGAEANLGAVRTALDSLAGYLLAHSAKRLIVVGYYSSEETNTTPYPDLGIARAEGIKEYLVGLGLGSDRISTSGELLKSLAMTADSVRGGINFVIKEPIPTTDEGLANAQKYKGVFEPMDLYFPTGSADYIKTEANQQFVEEAKTFLATNKDKKLSLIGHTDNDGNDAMNMTLSKERAEGVKKQLMSLGIADDQLTTDGKGESQPKESNDTPEGRRANRRVAIVIQ